MKKSYETVHDKMISWQQQLSNKASFSYKVTMYHTVTITLIGRLILFYALELQ